MAKHILIKRNRGFYGGMKTLKLFADKLYVGSVKRDESITITVPNNAEFLFGKMDWAKTDGFPLADIKDGTELSITTASFWDIVWTDMNPFSRHMPIRIERASTIDWLEFMGEKQA